MKIKISRTLEITRTENSFQTSIYRKPTFTGLSTKFTSFIPIQYKRNLVSTLIYRAFNICSTYLNFHSEVTYLRKLLFNNGFPYNFTDTHIGKALTKIISVEDNKTTTVEKRVVYFSTPYTGSHSFLLKRKLKELFNEFYPQISLKVVFKATNPMKNLFSIKEKIPKYLRSKVVYNYKCDRCNASYVGKCFRQFKARINEHMGRSPRTGNLLAKPPYSAIREHCEAEGHLPSKENFSILGSANTELELRIMEALFQHREKPTLGRSSYELLCF